MFRIILFLATNAVILILISIVSQLLGINGMLKESTNLNFQALLIISIIIGFSGSFISLLISKKLAKHSMSVQIIKKPMNETEEWLISTVKNYARDVRIRIPDIGIFNSLEPNAFATGATRNSALIAVSTGLLSIMNKSEVEAVLAHEISHVSNGDMVTLTLIQGTVNTFVIFFSRIIGYLIDRIIFRTRQGHGPGYYIGSVLAQMCLTIIASMIVMWFSRRREFLADRGGAKLAGYTSMIAALKCLKRTYHKNKDLPTEMITFGIHAMNGKFFRSHPPLEARIQALKSRRLKLSQDIKFRSPF